MSDFAWLKGLAPLLGEALLGPIGATAASFVAAKLGLDSNDIKTVTDVLSNGKLSPDQLLSIKAAELDFKRFLEVNKIDMAKLAVQNAADINKSMQAEAAAEHWPTYSWRPAIGFSFAGFVTAQWILPLFHMAAPTIDPTLMTAIGAILGVASWFRGKMQADPSIPTENKG